MVFESWRTSVESNAVGPYRSGKLTSRSRSMRQKVPEPFRDAMDITALDYFDCQFYGSIAWQYVRQAMLLLRGRSVSGHKRAQRRQWVACRVGCNIRKPEAPRSRLRSVRSPSAARTSIVFRDAEDCFPLGYRNFPVRMFVALLRWLQPGTIRPFVDIFSHFFLARPHGRHRLFRLAGQPGFFVHLLSPSPPIYSAKLTAQ